ncbi:hypothetical protein BLNAU_23048 [Blattamonas nauphoetae]|uniref:Uncharacterized protein n=1 Tax=Blattamonas nauphoetae TaxID=2049346 RepID=A0ABQ9WRC0_9EUKA|nr:hypothetical protein BLNAU_23048 [Blattamonas nauphoetae]
MNESHLFRICLKLTGWLQTTFEKWRSGSVFTKTVLDDILNLQINRAKSILRSRLDIDASDQSEEEHRNIHMSYCLPNPLRVKLALEFVIRVPRLLHTFIPFVRAKQAQIEQENLKHWNGILFSTANAIFSEFHLHRLTNLQQKPYPSFPMDIGLVRWALTEENTSDALPPTNEEDWSPSETGLSFSENLQFAAMWMLNGMVEFPFSRQSKKNNRDLPFLWQMLLNSILFHPPFDSSFAQIASQLRVCLWEEGVEDVVGAVGCLLDRSFGNLLALTSTSSFCD